MSKNSSENIEKSKSSDYERRNILELDLMKSFVSGGLAGIVAKTAIAPFERVKVIFQTSSEQFSYKKAFQTFFDILKTEGVLKLWRGNSLVAMRVFPYSAIQFTVYDSLRYYMAKAGYLGTQYNFIAGALAGVTSSMIMYPLELTRTRMAMRGEMSKFGLREIIKNTYKQEGIAGMYKGAPIAIVSIMTYKGIGFTFYEELYKMNSSLNVTNTILNFTSGAIAGIIGQTFSYPLDTFKKRAQVSSNFTEVNAAKLNILGLLKKIYTQEGIIRGLYKGFTLSLIKSPISNGIAFTTKNFLQAKVFTKEKQELRKLKISGFF